MANQENGYSQSLEIHQARAEEAKAIKELARIVCGLHASGVTVCCRLTNEDQVKMTDRLYRRVEGMTRTQIIQFLEEEKVLFTEFLSTNGNPGAHESRIGLQTLRLDRISKLLKTVPENIDSKLIIGVVDVSLGMSDNYGIEEFSLFQEALDSTNS
jgi:hypothetical protein